MERWKLTYVNRDAMLGEMPARNEFLEVDAETAGLEEQEILHRLHHLIEEHTDGYGVLTAAERI